MKTWILMAAVGGLVLVPVNRTFAQQVPGTGISTLVCKLDVHGNGTYSIGNGQLSVTVSGDTVSDGLGTATVTVQHGQTGSTHTLSYEDEGSGELDCGDVVLGVQ